MLMETGEVETEFELAVFELTGWVVYVSPQPLIRVVIKTRSANIPPNLRNFMFFGVID